MNLLRLSWRNLIAKPLSSFLSLMLLTLGVSIISLLLLLNKQLEENFNKNVQGIDMVVGAKGSPLQLILASVYHIDAPTGNIPLSEAQGLIRNPLVKKGIPLAYGDNYKGYRILGTDTSYTSHYGVKIVEGRLWTKEMEVSIGANVAARLNLKVGDRFHSAHDEAGINVHDHVDYEVVGIFGPSGTVIDQLILSNIESVWSIHSHEDEDHVEESSDHDHEEGDDHDHGDGEDHEGGEDHHHDEDREITALLIKFRSPAAMVALPRMINEQTSMQAALPAIEMNRLYSLMGVGINTLRALALAIIIISGISVFISLFNSLKARKYELALMRTMGASRGKLFLLIILEGMILAIGGFILGFLVSRVGMYVLSNMVADSYKYDILSLLPLPAEGILAIATIGIGLLAASLPALEAYNTQISRTLSEAS